MRKYRPPFLAKSHSHITLIYTSDTSFIDIVWHATNQRPINGATLMWMMTLSVVCRSPMAAIFGSERVVTTKSLGILIDAGLTVTHWHLLTATLHENGNLLITYLLYKTRYTISSELVDRLLGYSCDPNIWGALLSVCNQVIDVRHLHRYQVYRIPVTIQGLLNCMNTRKRYRFSCY